jgi:hypothetical protein
VAFGRTGGPAGSPDGRSARDDPAVWSPGHDAATRRDDVKEESMGKSRIAKKVDKLEKEADQLRKKAEKKGKQLQSQASERIEELSGKPKRSKKGRFAVFAAAAGAVAAVVLKKKRDQELDEALWEEPR